MISLCISLDRAVNSLPKHKSGYWANVAYVVGTRSAQECQEQYNAQQKTNKRPRKKASKKPATTEEPGTYLLLYNLMSYDSSCGCFCLQMYKIEHA